MLIYDNDASSGLWSTVKDYLCKLNWKSLCGTIWDWMGSFANSSLHTNYICLRLCHRGGVIYAMENNLHSQLSHSPPFLLFLSKSVWPWVCFSLNGWCTVKEGATCRGFYKEEDGQNWEGEGWEERVEFISCVAKKSKYLYGIFQTQR